MRLEKRERIAKRQRIALKRAQAIRSQQDLGEPIRTSMTTLNIVSSSNPGANLFRGEKKDQPTFPAERRARLNNQPKASATKQRWASS
jgi:hypothetical protein